jgi:hypothetical protein
MQRVIQRAVTIMGLAVIIGGCEKDSSKPATVGDSDSVPAQTSDTGPVIQPDEPMTGAESQRVGAVMDTMPRRSQAPQASGRPTPQPEEPRP